MVVEYLKRFHSIIANRDGDMRYGWGTNIEIKTSGKSQGIN